MDVITYQCRDVSYSTLVTEAPGLGDKYSY